MTDDLAAIARECGGIRSGSFDAVKQWTFTEDGLAEFIRRTLPAGVAASPGQPQSLETAHLVALLRAARRWVEEGGTISGYGFYRPENPHDFSPDPDSCTDEEMANHRAACEAWDRGDYKAPLGSESHYDEQGKLTMHITRAPWGIGSYTDIQDEAADLLAAIDCTLAQAGPVNGLSVSTEGTISADAQGKQHG